MMYISYCVSCGATHDTVDIHVIEEYTDETYFTYKYYCPKTLEKVIIEEETQYED